MWARAVPYDEFGRLRREAPVAWFPDGGSGFWSVHRYADIVAASRDVATFSSARGVSFEEPTDEDLAARRTIIDTDPPEHTKLRKIVSGFFSQRAVAVYEHFITGLTEQVLDQIPARGTFDFVEAVAKEVPIRVLARIMGLPAVPVDETTPTWSGPCWATIATGTGVTGHGIAGNDLTGHWLADHPDFVTRATRAGLPTLLAVGGWSPLAMPEDGGPLFAEATRREFVAAARTSLAGDGRQEAIVRNWDAADETVTGLAAAILADQAPRVSFVYLGAVDIAGHLRRTRHPAGPPAADHPPGRGRAAGPRRRRLPG